MVVDILFIIVTWLLKIMNAVLPPYGGATYTVYPDGFKEGVAFFINQLMHLNGIFPMDTVLIDLSRFSTALFWIITAKMAVMAMGYIRGSSKAA